MLPGCQQQYEHLILPGNQDDTSQLWHCLSFWKYKPLFTVVGQSSAFKLPINSENNINGYTGMHPSREQKVESTKATIPENTKMFGKYKPKHFIIGDSLTRDVNLPESVTMTKGGCDIKDVLNILDMSTKLGESEYQYIETVTMCVGTNPISRLHISLLSIM